MFVTLHEKVENIVYPLLVNTDNLARISVWGVVGCTLHFIGGTDNEIEVEESLEEIRNKLGSCIPVV